MILDTVAQSRLYAPLGAQISRALEYLETFSPAVADGRYDLDGDAVFALVQSYSTAPATEEMFESHQRHLDIHYIAEGIEKIQYAPVDSLVIEKPYVAEKDCAKYRDPVYSSDLILKAGSFAIFYPNDGHKPRCSVVAPIWVKKVVIKVRI